MKKTFLLLNAALAVYAFGGNAEAQEKIKCPTVEDLSKKLILARQEANAIGALVIKPKRYNVSGGQIQIDTATMGEVKESYFTDFTICRYYIKGQTEPWLYFAIKKQGTE